MAVSTRNYVGCSKCAAKTHLFRLGNISQMGKSPLLSGYAARGICL